MQGEAQTAAKAAGQFTAENTAATAIQHTPLRTLEALCAVARFHQIAADPANLRHQLGLQVSDKVGADELLRAAKHLGLKAKRSVTTAERLALTPLPALAAMRRADGSTGYVILAQCDGERVLFQDLSAAASRPTIEALKVFAAQWTGELILVTSRASLVGKLARFDFSWFIPALVKYRRLLGEVLLISFMLQLFALVSPLFFQVVMDKVLVHKGLTTLDVLVTGLVAVVIFESALNGLRSYVFSHTTSRIDVELGARLFRHLVQLPLAYFHARRVGDSVARVRELENIRSFLTGNALTVLLDVVFSFVFIAVMFFYSVTLTLIVLCSLPLYFSLSLAVVPILRKRLDVKFARGAENQAMLVETITGIQTVKASALEPSFARRWDNQLAAYTATRANGAPLPSWLSFDPATLTFRGTPANEDVGILAIELTASDPIGLAASDVFELTVANTNDAPVVAQGIASQATAEDEVWTFTIPADTFSDVDAGDTLACGATLADGAPLPPWLRFDAATRTFSGTPLNADVGSVELQILATDAAGASASCAFSLTVVNVNDAPVPVGSLIDWSIPAGDPVTYVVPSGAFDDIDVGDALRYSAGLADGGALPAWLAFDPDTRTFGGTPTANDSGDFVLEVTATDVDGLSASQTLRLQVGQVLEGTGGADTLIGGAGKDYLDGLAGADRMVGGKGDDRYVVDSSRDAVVELAGEGVDAVCSSVSYTLPANVENLVLAEVSGPPAPTLPPTAMVPGINGAGNELDNLLIGNSQNNELTGGRGADTLDGGQGNDRLLGGTGNDNYLFRRGSDHDTIEEDDTTAGNTDVALFGSDIAFDQLWFEKKGNDLQITVMGTNDVLAIDSWYKGSGHHVEQFRTSDGRTLLDSRVQNLVDAMAGFSPPAAGQTVLPPSYQTALAGVIAAGWQ